MVVPIDDGDDDDDGQPLRPQLYHRIPDTMSRDDGDEDVDGRATLVDASHVPPMES